MLRNGGVQGDAGQRRWKRAIAVLLGVSCLVALISFGLVFYLKGQPQTYASVEEAIIAHQLADTRSWLGANPMLCPCYVFFDEKDPAPEVMQRLSTSYLTFLPGRAWRKEEGGVRIYVGVPVKRADGTLSVGHYYRCGMMCGSSDTAVITNSGGRWLVLSSSQEWGM